MTRSLFPDLVTPLKFDTAAFDALDAEILSVFSRDQIVTPDQVQGTFPTLRDAVLQHGWPTLGETRGKFLFALDEDGDKIKAYQGGRKSLEGRVMFVNAPEDSPAAAYLTLNEALTDTARITRDVQVGFLVRTRARRRHDGGAQQRHVAARQGADVRRPVRLDRLHAA